VRLVMRLGYKAGGKCVTLLDITSHTVARDAPMSRAPRGCGVVLIGCADGTGRPGGAASVSLILDWST
jgi:hypothetical protein